MKIDIVKPIPHRIPTAIICLQVVPSGREAHFSFRASQQNRLIPSGLPINRPAIMPSGRSDVSPARVTPAVRPRVREGKQRQDHKRHPRVQDMLKRFGRRLAMLFLERDHKADNHPGKGRVNARLQHRRPQHRANQNIDPGTPHAAQIQGHQHRNRRRRRASESMDRSWV